MSMQRSVIDKLFKKLIELGFEPIPSDEYMQNFFIDFEHGAAQLPFKSIPETERAEFEELIKGSEYVDCYLNIFDSRSPFINGGSLFKIQINTDNKESVYALAQFQVNDLLSKYPYHIYGYDKDSDTEYLCGLCKTSDEAKVLVGYACEAEKSRTDVDRETRGVPDIDWIIVKCHGTTETYSLDGKNVSTDVETSEETQSVSFKKAWTSVRDEKDKLEDMEVER